MMDLAAHTSKPNAGSSNRSFGIVMAVFFGLLWALTCWKSTRIQFHPTLAVSALFLFSALLLPGVLTWPNWAWTKFGLVLHLVMSPLVLGGIYFLLFFPVGLLMRLCGKDPLNRKLDPQARTYWIRRSGETETSMKQQF